MASCIEIVEVRAAMTSSRKKSDDQSWLKGIDEKIEGRVMKTSEGPDCGSMPALKTAGKTIRPANTATTESSNETSKAVCCTRVLGAK